MASRKERHHGSLGNARYPLAGSTRASWRERAPPLRPPGRPSLANIAGGSSAHPGRLSACSDDVVHPLPPWPRMIWPSRQPTSPSSRSARAVPPPSAAKSSGGGGSPTPRRPPIRRRRPPSSGSGAALTSDAGWTPCAAARNGRCRPGTAVPCARLPGTTSTPDGSSSASTSCSQCSRSSLSSSRPVRRTPPSCCTSRPASFSLIGIEAFFHATMLRRLVRQRLPGESTRGMAWYIAKRSIRLRSSRIPPARVARGEAI